MMFIALAHACNMSEHVRTQAATPSCRSPCVAFYSRRRPTSPAARASGVASAQGPWPGLRSCCTSGTKLGLGTWELLGTPWVWRPHSIWGYFKMFKRRTSRFQLSNPNHIPHCPKGGRWWQTIFNTQHLAVSPRLAIPSHRSCHANLRDHGLQDLTWKQSGPPNGFQWSFFFGPINWKHMK